MLFRSLTYKHDEMPEWEFLALIVKKTGCGVLLARRARPAVAVAVAVVALDAILSFGGFFEWRGGSPTRAAVKAALSRRTPPPFGPVVDEPGGIDRYLFAGGDLAALPEQSPLTDVKGLRSANGSEALAPAGYLQAVGVDQAGEVRDATALWPVDSRILDLLRVTTVLVDPQSTRPVPDPERFGRGHPVPGSRLLRFEYRPRNGMAYTKRPSGVDAPMAMSAPATPTPARATTRRSDRAAPRPAAASASAAIPG